VGAVRKTAFYCLVRVEMSRGNHLPQGARKDVERDAKNEDLFVGMQRRLGARHCGAPAELRIPCALGEGRRGGVFGGEDVGGEG